MAHLFDASSTYIAVDFYGYSEQHVLPNALTGLRRICNCNVST